MKLGYIILHVPDVLEAVAFYENAFKLKTKFIDKSQHYAEMDTGETTLAFASHELIGVHIRGYNHKDLHPHGYEVSFVTKNIHDDFQHAITNGAVPVASPHQTRWRQMIAYVRDLNGALVEFATPYEDNLSPSLR